LNDVQLQVSKIDKSSINIREEAKLLDFYSSIGSQGFKIIDLEVCEDNSILKLQDMQSYSDFSKRGIHTSQFLYNLWIYSNSSRLVIEYHLPNGEKFLASEISSDNFKNHAETNSLSELLKEVKFTPFIIDYQNKNPFESLAYRIPLFYPKNLPPKREKIYRYFFIQIQLHFIKNTAPFL